MALGCSPGCMCVSQISHCASIFNTTIFNIMEAIHLWGYWSHIHHCGIQKGRHCTELINKTDVLTESSPRQFQDDITKLMSFNHPQGTSQLHDCLMHVHHRGRYIIFTCFVKPSSASWVRPATPSVWSHKMSWKYMQCQQQHLVTPVYCVLYLGSRTQVNSTPLSFSPAEFFFLFSTTGGHRGNFIQRDSITECFLQVLPVLTLPFHSLKGYESVK